MGRTPHDFERIFELSGELLCVIAEGAFARVSAGWHAQLGWSQDELLGRRCIELIHPDDLDRTLSDSMVAAGGDEELVAFENRYRHADGSYRWLSWSARSFEDGVIYAVARDVTEAKAKEAALEISDERYRLLADLGLRALEQLDLQAVLDHAVSMVADTLGAGFCDLLELTPSRESLMLRAGCGWRPGAVGSALVPFGSGFHAGFTFSSLGQVVVEDFAAETRFAAAPLLREHGVAAGVCVIVGGKRRPFGVLGAYTKEPRAFGSDEVNFLQAVANILSDAIERHRSEERVRHQALHDPLTGLPNRALLIDRMTRWHGRACATGERVALLYVDVDHFKLINDGLGHDVGDKLLISVAARLGEAIGPQGTVARIGGDEFVALLEDVTGEEQALDAVDRVIDAFRGPFALGPHLRQVTASVGVALGDAETDGDALLRNADAAMYSAKENGRARSELFDEAMRNLSLARIELERDLREALDRDELYNVYQPIVTSRTGDIVALEALVRWAHPTRGIVSPVDFIPVAERTGLIVEVGEAVLERACRQAFAWRSAGLIAEHVRINVNLSPRQVTHPQFVESVAEILAATGIDGSALSLEITESVLMDDSDGTLETLRELKSLGVRLVLDDFGTGYSSLAYVRRFPIDVLKIDRAFVDALGEDAEDAAIVTAIISMGSALGVTVVAEGVEVERQATQLRALGCDLAQGFLYAKPLPAAETSELLMAAGAHAEVALPPLSIDGFDVSVG
jgi:diguanylate cyclase (GGDEF)-like protein/PAS domain S-box-containing protein